MSMVSVYEMHDTQNPQGGHSQHLDIKHLVSSELDFDQVHKRTAQIVCLLAELWGAWPGADHSRGGLALAGNTGSARSRY